MVDRIIRLIHSVGPACWIIWNFPNRKYTGGLTSLDKQNISFNDWQTWHILVSNYAHRYLLLPATASMKITTFCLVKSYIQLGSQMIAKPVNEQCLQWLHPTLCQFNQVTFDGMLYPITIHPSLYPSCTYHARNWIKKKWNTEFKQLMTHELPHRMCIAADMHGP